MKLRATTPEENISQFKFDFFLLFNHSVPVGKHRETFTA